jgi:hypothetical protein
MKGGKKMPLYPYNFKIGQIIQTDVPDVNADHAFLAHFQVDPTLATAASTTGIHAAVTDTGVDQVITTGITQPSVPRNITATAGGTATSIKAIQVTITGTNYLDQVITEIIPAFTVDTAGTVTGNKAFKTITSITIPAHDAVTATTAVGFGEKLGIPYLLTFNSVLAASIGNVREATAPTVTVSPTAIESNTVDLATALSSQVIDLLIAV